ncbi:MAG TPA: hypothetical protein VFX40_05320 [Gemmatimonadaceae bacterium]|nr:hypothetical protein [Gemmatimonadaceae bacterium]
MSQLSMYARLAAGLPALLRQRITPEAARAVIEQRLRAREENFLRLARLAVFERPESPYRFLMREAGCEPGDVESLVRSDGIDAALLKLERAGMRVTFEEFKGRAPLVRGGREFETTDASFDNPIGKASLVSQTTGSTGTPTRVKVALDHLQSNMWGRVLIQEANGVFGLPTVLYRAGLPSTAAVGAILSHIVMGNPVRRWFSSIDASSLNTPIRFRAAGMVLPAMVRLSGHPFPRQEWMPMSEAAQVARVASDFVRTEGRCLLRAAVSTLLTVAVAAREKGISLEGVTCMGGSEPASVAKVRGIRQSGAAYVTNYSMNEAGMIGGPCANGLDDTDVHLWSDALALVPGSRVADIGDDSLASFALTSLMLTAPKILINVDIDDYGILERRRCGCLLGETGLDQHIRQIRSSAKLTGRGVTLVGSDIVRVIEEVMPARFGGGPQDYQLVEEEMNDGRTMLTLLVSPSVDLADEAAPVTVLFEELATGRPGASFSGAVLKGSAAVRVRREQPVPNARGKQPPFRVAAAAS